MTSAAPHGDPAAARGPRDALERFAAVWCRAVYPVSTTSLSRAELQAYLETLAARLHSLLAGRPFHPWPARDIGAALVRAHCTDPQALAQTLDVIESYLLLYCPADLSGEPGTARNRLTRLQHHLAAGYARELRERALGEQEAISRAALTAQVRAEQALRASEARFQALFRDAAIGIGIADLQGRIVDVNDALARMLAASTEDLRHLNVTDFVHPDDTDGVWELYQDSVRGDRDHFRAEKPYFRQDGSVVWTDLTVSLIRDDQGRPQYQVAMMEDITERRMLHDRLHHQATHDPLTGLPNRALFLERLGRAMAPDSSIGSVGVCYLDLDGFKTVNDSLGHHAGDQLLSAVAERFRHCLDDPGKTVARMGGDEFTVLVADPAGEEEMADLARQLIGSLGTAVQVGGRPLSVTVSAGVLACASDAMEPAEVVQAADIALLRAKAEGTGRWVLYDADSHAREIARSTLRTHLPTALERGEFFLEYQPLVSLRDGGVVGAEALVRWRHPQHGTLGPDAFVPLAEQTGLIVPLGRWVLEAACRQARAWQRQLPDIPLRINVNLAPRQARSPELVHDVLRILKEAELDPEVLCLEVTENALIGADDQALHALRRLTDHGVTIALDDFGTGYSNFSHLHRLPVHSLKIDRSLTGDLSGPDLPDPTAEKILTALVSLARALGLAVTAEGVETADQADRLRALGCDTAQGWLYGRPGPAERLPALAASAVLPC
ncbi:putative bifunctional diguanylate cyclase/phosphodiesterase [Peterkaempfera bronchialis]|uniref:EAL domain-containing protein n=1 Tax=Peterkaempfera bronchialis TaxID=2126346 RepID=A0A345SUF0_9ACTN|nr:bifunctional diguanylate cyclase/phosphodiesterase [Peterkaempfera bronchialis]AXI77355.1 EAL domain-containing protein [Peterkaempfera bronchialis]